MPTSHNNNTDVGLVVPRVSVEAGLSAESTVYSSAMTVQGAPWTLSARSSDIRGGLTPSTLASRPSMATLVNGNMGAVGGRRSSIPELEGKDPAEQLETLMNMLEKTTRLKEGAENLLRMNMTNTARMHVESELHQANDRIGAINKEIESVTSQKRKGLVASNRQHDSGYSRSDGGDDYKAAKQQALDLLKVLLSYSRHQLSSVSASSASTSGAPPPPATVQELERIRLETMNRLISILQRDIRIRLEINTDDLIRSVTPMLADSAPAKARGTAYRLMRHSLVDPDSVERLLEHPIEYYILKSLIRDNKYVIEREQVIKLIRAIVEIGSERRANSTAGLGHVPLSEPIMRALISVAEHSEDPLRHICCETLVEILLIDIDLMARTGGTRVLFQCLAEGPTELAPLIATAFLYIVDVPKTRAYLNSGTDLEIALSGITDAYGKGNNHTERMRSASKVISVILRTWSGLIYLCMNDMLAIRTLINTLRIPSLETREVVLDMFFELLNIETPEWYKQFIEGRRLTMYRRHRPHLPVVKEEQPVKSSDKLRVTDQYVSMLATILAKAGLFDALSAMLEETTTGSALSRKATLLIAEFLQISNKVLPLTCAAKVQTIPKIFELAADYINSEHRIVGTSALAAIDSFNRNKARLQPVAIKDSRQRSNSVEDHVRRGQRQVEQVKMKLAMQMDDKTFQTLIIDTQVMLNKEYGSWKFETLLDLIEGPLLNAKRLEEAIRVSKLVKRLMTFFHPFSHRFSDIKNTKTNHKWIRLGCTLINTLVANPEGIRYLLSEDELLPQIYKSFVQLENTSSISDVELIFSRKRVEDTLTFGYFEMLGTLSRTKEGLELLDKHKLFTSFYQLSELHKREDLIKRIIENLDYSIEGHPRIVLSKALTSSHKQIRLHATKHLGNLIQTSPRASVWMLRLLLNQLCDPDPEVCESAIHFLEEACESQDVLKIVVDARPTLDHLGDIANALLYKFMATPVGFQYLYDGGFIEREMDLWLHEFNSQYVIDVEIHLSKELNSGGGGDGLEESIPYDGAIPPHFYGELAKTELGCQVLQEKGHFSSFAHFVRQHALEGEGYETIQKLKSILWAIGNIASTEKGLHFLEEEEIIPVIIEIAGQSPVLSVRGTCFFVLGLVSSTTHGAEVLYDYGWESTLSPLGYPTGLCVPVDIDKFIYLPSWEVVAAGENPQNLVPPATQEEIDVISAIGNLVNTVVANAASRSLARMKAKPEYRAVFSSPSVYYRVIHIISTRRYRLPVRRYILDLFDVQLDAGVVQTLVDCSHKLAETGTTSVSTSPNIRKVQPRIMSMFGRSVRGRRPSESDEDDSVNSSDEEEKTVVDRPVSLLPVQRVVGFLQDSEESSDGSTNDL